jgi:three-Cys-motif partner protein
MGAHEFGGDWTSEKLDRVRKYLAAYTKIFARNPRAQHFATIYVDAFAGTGYRIPSGRKPSPLTMLPELGEHENEQFLKGSARIALEVEPPFDRYLFIEQDAERARELERLKQQFPLRAARIEIAVAEANQYLKDWCARKSYWRDHRAVVFLDPYGMQVEWTLIQAIARTRAIDLWILFPLGMAVNRLLTRNEPPPDDWAQTLTRFFGTDSWRQAFYRQQQRLTLFGEETAQLRQADFGTISQFFINRLKSEFDAVAENPLPLFNSRGVPLYLLCFAASNPQGAPTALKIAEYILGGKHGSRQQD